MMRYFLLLLLLWSSGALLAQKEDIELVVSQGHHSNVRCLAFSEDGRFLATAGDDRSLRIWSMRLQQEYKVLWGHKAAITDVGFSKDGQFLVSIGSRLLCIWSMPEGKLLHQIEVDAQSKRLQFSETKPGHVMVRLPEGIAWVDLKTGAIDYSPKPFMRNWSNWILGQKTARVIIPERLDSIWAYSLAGQREQLFVGKGSYYKLLLSPNENYLAAYSGSRMAIDVWAYSSGKFIGSIEGLNPVQDFCFDISGERLWIMDLHAECKVYSCPQLQEELVVNKKSWGKEGLGQGDLVQVNIGQQIRPSPNGQFMGLAITRTEVNRKTGKMNDLRGLQLVDAQTGKERGLFKGHFKWITQLGLSPKGDKLLSVNMGKTRGLRSWSIKKGEIERYIHSSQSLSQSQDKKQLALLEFHEKSNPELTVYQLPSFRKLAKKKVDNCSAFALSGDGKKIVALQVDVNLKNPLNNRFYYSIWKLPNYKLEQEIEIESKESALPIFKSLLLDSAGDYLLAAAQNQAYSLELSSQKRTRFALPSSATYWRMLCLHPQQPALLFAVSEVVYNQEKKRVEELSKLLLYNYKTGELIEEVSSPKEGIIQSAAFSPDGQYLLTGQTAYQEVINFDVLLWDWPQKQLLCQFEGHNGGINDLAFDPLGKKAYSCSEDGLIKAWDIEKCALAASFIGYNELDYLIISPENYYKTSRSNTAGLGFRYAGDLYTYDQFDLRFNRPDKVLAPFTKAQRKLNIYTKAWKKRVRRLGFTEEQLERKLQLPELQIVNQLQLPIYVEDSLIQFQILAFDEQEELKKLRIFVNGVPYPQAEGIELSSRAGDSLRQELSIPLGQGPNKIQLSVVNAAGLESAKQSFQLAYQPKEKQASQLYFLGLGVSEFRDSSRNLKYPQKDAQDLGKALAHARKEEGVHQLLLDPNAPLEQLQKSARAFMLQAKINDQIVFYISSHGLLDDSLNYYLALPNSQFEQPQNGSWAYDDMEQLLDGLPCRNRLLLLDACHSGEVDKEVETEKKSVSSFAQNILKRSKSGSTLIRPKTGLNNSFAYMKALFSDLEQQRGVTVISAAGGFELAYESDEWGNGLFTYALLEGIKSKKADLNNDGQIPILELRDFLSQRVLELSQGQQQPTARQSNVFNNFILYRYD
ncbi:WD40 repeat-containing protein [Saprospira grandis DSM 2844]|uniref:WD40 repeat-containing protein n=1 Tax=Saprospira grandis DSM 2844 TaxID=694433 RepID=J0P563_9BACT|nr:caspase family protein [Saprospira grandis]EJF52582.1 WD40 repeat-containing protein [Saprospira grandis DSM 2844]